ncbi:hypothetical protein ACX9R5_18610 [Rathayibacter sp. CAU 1779]
MIGHEFTIILDRPIREDDESDYDALFETGFDDSSPANESGRGVIHIDREAGSLVEAILSAVVGARAAGFDVVGIEDDDLVTLKGIAERVGRTYESIRLYATGKRGPGGFPAPMTADGYALYSWAAVSDWLSAHTKLTSPADDRARTLAAADHLLRAHALMPDLQALATLAA